MTSQKSTSDSFLILAAFLLLLGAGYRVARAVYFPELPNFSPVMAMAFCGGWFFPLPLAAGMVFGALIVSDVWIGVALGMGFEWYMVLQYAAYAFALAMGAWLGKGPFSPSRFFAGVLWNAIVFYLVTNTGAWMANPQYAKTIAGWIQALSTGIPGYPPTWTFFRNSLFSDLLFSGSFAAAWGLAGKGRKVFGGGKGKRTSARILNLD